MNTNVMLTEDEMKEMSQELLSWGEDKDLTPHQFCSLLYHLSLYVAHQIEFDVKDTIMKKPEEQVN